jgi:hypothetical protein
MKRSLTSQLLFAGTRLAAFAVAATTVLNLYAVVRKPL